MQDSALEPASTLVFLLPGRGGAMADFEHEGIVAVLRAVDGKQF